jgi:hypothetical protein
VPAIQSPADYEHCLLEILRSAGGRASRGHVQREFERRYYSSVPREAQEGAPPRWARSLDDAKQRLVRRKVLFAPDPDLWELP